MSGKYYSEPPEASEHMRALYAESIANAERILRSAAAEEREANVTPGYIAENREKFRKEYSEKMGMERCREIFGSGVPEAETTKIGEDEYADISRVKLKIADGVYFTGVLFVPKKRAEKAPLAVMSHGGGGTPELCCDMIGQNNYGGVPRRLTEEGVVVFAPQLLLWNLAPKLTESNPPQFGTGYNRNETDSKMRHSGGSVAAFEIYAISRSIDWLSAQEYIDGDRIGMLGLSYGGFYTLYTMAYDKRIKTGWSAAFFNDRSVYCWRDYVCDGSARRFSDPEIAGLCAPRRLCVDIGREDTVFKAEYAAGLAEKTAEFFKAAGAQSNLRFNEWDGGHRFSANKSFGTDSFEFFMCGLK